MAFLLLSLASVYIVPSPPRRTDPALVIASCTVEAAEKPHGGEPDVRVVRVATASTSSDTVISSAAPGSTYFAVIHEPWPGSASNVIIDGIVLDQKTPTTHPALTARPLGEQGKSA